VRAALGLDGHKLSTAPFSSSKSRHVGQRHKSALPQTDCRHLGHPSILYNILFTLDFPLYFMPSHFTSDFHPGTPPTIAMGPLTLIARAPAVAYLNTISLKFSVSQPFFPSLCLPHSPFRSPLGH
jgi:hypothetical protein